MPSLRDTQQNSKRSTTLGRPTTLPGRQLIQKRPKSFRTVSTRRCHRSTKCSRQSQSLAKLTPLETLELLPCKGLRKPVHFTFLAPPISMVPTRTTSREAATLAAQKFQQAVAKHLRAATSITASVSTQWGRS